MTLEKRTMSTNIHKFAESAIAHPRGRRNFAKLDDIMQIIHNLCTKQIL